MGVSLGVGVDVAGNGGVSDGTAVSKPVGVAVGVPVAGKVVAVRHRLAA